MEWIWYVLSRVHDEFIWLDRPYKITKQVIQVVTCLSATGEVLSLRKVSNNTVITTTGSKFDNKAMTMSDILKYNVKFASMIVCYKVYQSSR